MLVLSIAWALLIFLSEPVMPDKADLLEVVCVRTL